MRRRRHLLDGASVALALAGCSGPDVAPRPGALPTLPALVALADADPSPGRFDGFLEAAPVEATVAGEEATFWTYGGALPGPLIRVTLGDRVNVRFHNALPGVDTSVHWHGVEGYARADGTPVTAALVPPAGGTTYTFDATRPGTYWYHPHHRGAAAVFQGLYGVLQVDEPLEDELVAAGVLPAAEQILVLSDVSVVGGVVVSAEVDEPMTVMNGLEGEHLLVNGQVLPTLEVPTDGIRLRLVNPSITRFWRLSLPGQRLLRVGGESGLLDAVRLEGGAQDVVRADGSLGTWDPGFAEGEVLLAPGERTEVVWIPDGLAPGDELALRWEDTPRGRHGMWMDGDEMVMGDAPDDGARPGVDVAVLRVVAGGPPSDLAPGDPLRPAPREVVPDADVTVVWEGRDARTLDERMEMRRDDDGTWSMTSWFGMDGVSWAHAHGPDAPEAPSARHARLGDVVALEVHNTTGMTHPWHLHGFTAQPRALVLEDGSTWRFPDGEWEDTVAIPAHARLRVVVPLRDPAGDGSAAGRWMEHCHLLQHAERGMMSEWVVAP